MDFCERYSHHFVQQGMNSVGHARHYLSGLLGTQRRKNIETIHQDVVESDYQGMEQFISSSPWCHRALLDQVAKEADALLGDESETGLFIDESSFLKKGSASVGVQRQWAGRAGKLENCQVGVFACMGRHEQMAITDLRLYLPQSWVQDASRCLKAKVPEGERRYEAKWQQALEMVHHARELGLRYGWVGVDSLYGSNAAFLNELEDMGQKFMADVSKVTKVWTSKPGLQAVIKKPAQAGGRPRKHPQLRDDNAARYLSVAELVAERFEAGSVKLCYRQGHKGKLWTRFWATAVWCWEKDWAQPRKRMLAVRREADGSFKYSLSNLQGASWERYAWMQGQRFWMEHAFHEAKSQLGMAQYQVRVWRGWHHHMSLVCLALLFSTRLKLQSRAEAPLLSTRDITELLDYYLPRKGLSEAEVIGQIRQRHRQREADLNRRRNHRIGLMKI
jgi:SRSO17 transposase